MSEKRALVYIGSPHFDGIGLLNTEARRLQEDANVTILDGIATRKYPEIKNFNLVDLLIWKGFRRRQFFSKLDQRCTNYLSIKEVLSDKTKVANASVAAILNESIIDHCVCNNITGSDIVSYKRRHSKRQYEFLCRVHEGLVRFIRAQKFTKVVIFNGRNTLSRVLALVAKDECVPVHWIEYFGKRENQMTYIVSPVDIFDFDAMSDYILCLYKSCQDPKKDLIAQQCLEDRVTQGDPLLMKWGVKVASKPENQINHHKQTVVFFFSSEDEYPAVKKSTFGFSPPDKQYNIFLQICKKILEAGLEKRYRYVIKLHPRYVVESVKLKCARKLWDDAINQAKDLGFNFEMVSPLDSAYSVIRTADLVFSFGSTAWEATYLGKPAVLLGPSLFSSHDCAYIAHSAEDVLKNLQRIPKPKPVQNCFPYAWAWRELGHVAPKYQPPLHKMIPLLLRNVILNRFSENDHAKQGKK